MNKLFTIILILIATHTNGQFIDFSRANAYHAFFVETDAFDSSYLTVLANAYERVLFRVADNGIGKQINATPKGTGFGTELVNLLCNSWKAGLRQIPAMEPLFLYILKTQSLINGYVD